LDFAVSFVGRLVGSPRLRMRCGDGGSCGRSGYGCWSLDLDPLEIITVDPNSSYETFPISHQRTTSTMLVLVDDVHEDENDVP